MKYLFHWIFLQLTLILMKSQLIFPYSEISMLPQIPVIFLHLEVNILISSGESLGSPEHIQTNYFPVGIIYGTTINIKCSCS